jgi:hypothetical protein
MTCHEKMFWIRPRTRPPSGLSPSMGERRAGLLGRRKTSRGKRGSLWRCLCAHGEFFRAAEGLPPRVSLHRLMGAFGPSYATQKHLPPRRRMNGRRPEPYWAACADGDSRNAAWVNCARGRTAANSHGAQTALSPLSCTYSDRKGGGPLDGWCLAAHDVSRATGLSLTSDQ